ncbi:MAG: type II toxin-antitoxin system PemK/MazF family toxin [Actinomycetota bacterium]|nr:type II toxin-antitoxin system PemK/MazF family toxin [Actinomycetota bacterium]
MRRGDVYEFRLPKGRGDEQRGKRLGVVVQADALLPRSVVVIAPTSRSARSASFRPEIVIGEQPTKVLVEQLGAADATRLGDLVGHVSPEEMWGIDEALLTVLGLL